MTVNTADLVMRPHVAVTVCVSDAEAPVGTVKVTSEPSAGEVSRFPPSHCHTIVGEMLDATSKQSSNPVAVAVIPVCPAVPWSGESETLGSTVAGGAVTVKGAEDKPFLEPAHCAVTEYVPGVALSGTVNVTEALPSESAVTISLSNSQLNEMLGDIARKLPPRRHVRAPVAVAVNDVPGLPCAVDSSR
jgi:hypothetical protein